MKHFHFSYSKRYHANNDIVNDNDNCNDIVNGIAQLKTFSCAKKRQQLVRCNR